MSLFQVKYRTKFRNKMICTNQFREGNTMKVKMNSTQQERVEFQN